MTEAGNGDAADSALAFARRRQATAEARLTDVETAKLLAHATSTCMVMAG